MYIVLDSLNISLSDLLVRWNVCNDCEPIMKRERSCMQHSLDIVVDTLSYMLLRL